MPEADLRFYEFGPFRVDVEERQLLREGQPVALTEKVFDLLLLLVSNHGRAITKADLMKRLWPDTVVEENNLTVNMSLLRKALGEGASDRRYIETLPRRGYRFVANVSRAGALDTADHTVGSAAAPKPDPRAGAEPSLSDRTTLETTQPRRVFVGRERELAWLERAFDAARLGHGRVIFVTGAPGMGKTELCEQLLVRHREGVLVATGHCFEHLGAKEAYAPFLEIIRTLLAGPRGAEVQRALERHAPAWCVQFAASFGDATPPAGTRGVDGGRVVREIADVIEALAALEPIVLLLEDLHWADPSSLDVIRVVAHRIGGHRALLLGTMRAEDAELENPNSKNLRRELLARDRAEELALPLLEAGAIASYIDARFGDHDLPPELGLLVHRTTEGQPLFATRLVQLLIQRGDLVEASGRWVLNRSVDELAPGVPSNVRAVIERKLDALDERDRRALQFASVIGVEFSAAMLAALVRQDEIALDERLNELAQRHRLLDLIGEETASAGRTTTRYRFAHALYQNVLYESLAAQRRMALHADVAAGLMAQAGRTHKRAPAQIAAHLEHARDFRRAIDLWIEAADLSSRLYADVQAADQYRHALSMLERLDAAERVPLRIILLYNHAWCRSKIGEHDTGLREFEAMQRYASEPEFAGEGEAPARARAAVFEFFEQPWRDAFGVYDMARMPNQDRSLGPSAIQCEAYWGMCYTLLEASRLEELRARAAEFLKLADASNNLPRRAEALAWMAGLELELTHFSDALRCADESARIALAHDHFRTVSLSEPYRATVEYHRADYESAERRLERCLALTYEAQGRLTCLLDLARTRMHGGDAAGARAALEDARDIAERKARDAWTIAILSVHGELHRELGELDAALECFGRALELAARLRSTRLELETLVQLGHVHALRSDPERAGAELERAEQLLAEAGREGKSPFPTPLRGRDFALMHGWARAELELAKGELEDAEHSAKALLQLASEAESPRHVAVSWDLLARTALARGNRRAASKHADSGLGVLGKSVVPFVRARLAATARAATAGARATRRDPH